MKLHELWCLLHRETTVGIIVNGEFKGIYEEYPDAYSDLKVDYIAPVQMNGMNIYLIDNTRQTWLDTDSAEGRCLGDISE